MSFQENEESADIHILMKTLNTCPKQNPPLRQKLSLPNPAIRKHCTMNFFKPIIRLKCSVTLIPNLKEY